MIKKKQTENYIFALISVLLVCVAVAVMFDYYYDLNDDVLIKDIISGDYSGIPHSHNFQNLWSFSLLVSVIYRIIPNVSWYGMILIGFQFLSIFIIVERSLRIFDNEKIVERLCVDDNKRIAFKGLFAISESVIISILMLYHLSNVQYTVTVSFISAAAVLWISTLEATDNLKKFVKTSVPAILLVAAGYLIRPEMMLLMLPFVGLSGVIRWSYEEHIFTVVNIKKYFLVFFIMVGIMGVGFASDKLAYSSSEWKEFIDLFNARTQLYDYQVIPPYQGNESFYEGIGLSEQEAVLFENYNFGIDSKIDAALMWEVVDYAKDKRSESKSFSERFFEKLSIYKYEFTHGRNSVGSDYPYNIVVIALYLLVIALSFGRRDYLGLLRPLVLFAGRSAIWMYILLGDRSPDRITHSLYLIEFAVLVGILVLELSRNDRKTSVVLTGIAVIVVLFIGLSIFVFKDQYNWVKTDQENRVSTNNGYNELYEYMASNKDSFYLMDVYSSVSYSEKIFGELSRVSKSNTEILGGWACNSPIQKDKLKRFGDSMEEALLNEGVFFVRKSNQPMDWLGSYYSNCGVEIAEEKITDIGDFEIYDIGRK